MNALLLYTGLAWGPAIFGVGHLLGKGFKVCEPELSATHDKTFA